MKFVYIFSLFAAFFIGELSSLSAQERVKPAKETDTQILDPSFDLTIFEKYEWFNCDAPQRYLKRHDAIFLIIYWNNLILDAEIVIEKIETIQKKNPALHPLVVYNALHKQESQFLHKRFHILKNNIPFPTVFIDDEQFITSMNLDRYPLTVMYSPRHGALNEYDTIDELDEIENDFKTIIKDPKFKNYQTFSTKFHKVSDDFPDPVLSRFSDIESVPSKDWIFLSQPQKNRIVIADLEGNILRVIGYSQSGQVDGRIFYTRFHHPQGTAWHEVSQTLYVADTYNNSIRKIDFNSDKTTTIIESIEGENSRPHDVFLKNGILYCAMTGTGEIWKYGLKSEKSEILKDTKGTNISFNNPSALSVNDEGEIYVVELAGKLKKILTTGEVVEIEMETPVTKVLCEKTFVYITSAYADQIIILEKDEIINIIGSGQPGFKDDTFEKSKFLEPYDITFIDDRLYVSDIGNDAIRFINKKNSKVGSIEYTNVLELAYLKDVNIEGNRVQLEEILLAPGKNYITFEFDILDGYEIVQINGLNEIEKGNSYGNITIEDGGLSDGIAVISFEGEENAAYIDLNFSLSYMKLGDINKIYQKTTKYIFTVNLDQGATNEHLVILPLID